jgi:hypothetical protein
MKFFIGFVVGIASTILAMFLLSGGSASEEPAGLIFFPQKEDCITKRELVIFQTIKPHAALAEFGAYPDKVMVLITNTDGVSYYDRQKIKIPPKKCARQIGTYQYMTKMEVQRTVPAVIIE